MRRIALFGGSFDPIHRGHVQIIDALRSEFDEVRVIPCGTPPHKSITPAAERLDMLKLCVSPQLIDTIEIDSPTVSYTCDTLAHYRRQYPGEKLYYCIGADSLAQINLWKSPESIARLATLYVIRRRDYEDKIEKGAQFFKVMYGGDAEISGITAADMSSSELRVRFAFGDYSFVSAPVAQYIKSNGLYTQYNYITSRYAEFGLSAGRIVHTKRTAIMATRLAGLYGINIHTAITAALLHDIGKRISKEDAHERGFIDDAEFAALEGVPSKIHHASIGASIAQKEFGITDTDILNAIASHTTGRENMSQLEKVVFLADYLEEGRDIDNLEHLCNLALRDIDEGVKAVLAATLDYLRRDSREIDTRTQRAFNYYNK